METNENEEQSTPQPAPQPVPAPTPQPVPAPTLSYDQVITVTPEAQAYLRETGKWASFLSVMGFIFCGLILIVALFVGVFFSFISRFSPAYNSIPQSGFGFISVFYIMLDVLYFFFPFYLYRFADRIKKGIVYTDTAHVTEALGNLKSFFKLWGIVTIVAVSLYALIFIIVIIVGVGAASLSR